MSPQQETWLTMGLEWIFLPTLIFLLLTGLMLPHHRQSLLTLFNQPVLKKVSGYPLLLAICVGVGSFWWKPLNDAVPILILGEMMVGIPPIFRWLFETPTQTKHLA